MGYTHFDGVDAALFKIAGTQVTATATELNALASGGLSSSELGVLDGVTAGTLTKSKGLVVSSTGSLDISGIASSASTTGSWINTGTTWIDHTAAGGGCLKLLCSTSAASGDFHTLRIRARSDAASTGGIVAGNFSASANIAQYGNLFALQGYAQPGSNAQTGGSNIICGVYSCTDLTATGSSGRDWSLWTDTHMAAKAAGGSYLHRLSHNGTVANDGCWTIYGGGRMPVLMNIEDATPGFVTATPGTYSTADGTLTIKINGSTYYLPYFAAVD